MVQSQEDKWKLMVDQDPCSGSVAWNSGHGTMAATHKDEPIDSTEELVGTLGGVNKSVTAEHLSDVEWGKPQTPAAASTPFQTLEEDKAVSSLESPLRKKPCFQELIAECLSKAVSPTCLKPDYSDTKLVRYTQPPLVNVIPLIKYEAQNMLEPSFRQELQCIKEVKHL